MHLRRAEGVGRDDTECEIHLHWVVFSINCDPRGKDVVSNIDVATVHCQHFADEVRKGRHKGLRPQREEGRRR